MSTLRIGFLMGSTVLFIAVARCTGGRLFSPAGAGGKAMEISHDLGVIVPRSSVEGTIKIANNSNIAWHAAKIASDCGCTVQALEPPDIQPGCESTLTIRHTAGAVESRINRRISISFHEPDAPQITVNLSGAVRKPISVTPEFVNLGDVSAEQPYVKHVELLGRRGLQIDWDHVRHRLPWTKITRKQITKVIDEADGSPGRLRHAG